MGTNCRFQRRSPVRVGLTVQLGDNIWTSVLASIGLTASTRSQSTRASRTGGTKEKNVLHAD